MSDSRKELIRKYKERKPDRGAFAIRCTTTGKVWVGSTPNLYAAQNRAWFALRLGGHPDKSLQAEWNTQGPEAFKYEVLERLDEDILPIAVADLLKEKQSHWVSRLAAKAL